MIDDVPDGSTGRRPKSYPLPETARRGALHDPLTPGLARRMGTLPAPRSAGTRAGAGVTLPRHRRGVALSVFVLQPSYLGGHRVDPGAPRPGWAGPGPYVVGPATDLSAGRLGRTTSCSRRGCGGMRLYLRPQGAGRLRCARDLQGQGAGAPGHVPTRGGRLRKSFHALQHGARRAGARVPGDSVGAALGFAWVPSTATLGAGRTVEFTVSGPSDARRCSPGSEDVLGLDRTSCDSSCTARPGEGDGDRECGRGPLVAAAATEARTTSSSWPGSSACSWSARRRPCEAPRPRSRSFRVRVVTQYVDGSAPVTPNLLYPRDRCSLACLDMKVNRELLQRDGAGISRISPGRWDSAFSSTRSA